MNPSDRLINTLRTGRYASPDALSDILLSVARDAGVDPEDMTVEIGSSEESSQDYEEDNSEQDSGDFKETDQIINKLKMWVEGPKEEQS